MLKDSVNICDLVYFVCQGVGPLLEQMRAQALKSPSPAALRACTCDTSYVGGRKKSNGDGIITRDACDLACLDPKYQLVQTIVTSASMAWNDTECPEVAVAPDGTDRRLEGIFGVTCNGDRR